jgi:hypothetical protein
MKKYYTVDGYGEKDGLSIGREFYMGTSLGDAEHIYNVLRNKLEPEYSELTQGVEYNNYFLNG